MFTLAEAEEFVKDLLENVFPKGKIERLAQFYDENLVGHFQGKTLCFEDVKKRVLAIKNNTTHCHFEVKNVVVFDQFIALSCKQNWINKQDGSFYDSIVFGIYRISQRKIVELWMILDTKTGDYQQVNQDFTNTMFPFEINHRIKATFLQRLAQLPPDEFPELSMVEKECLYYYLHGASAKEAALILQLSPRTIETYLAGIKEKCHCRTKHQLRKKFFPK